MWLEDSFWSDITRAPHGLFGIKVNHIKPLSPIDHQRISPTYIQDSQTSDYRSHFTLHTPVDDRRSQDTIYYKILSTMSQPQTSNEVYGSDAGQVEVNTPTLTETSLESHTSQADQPPRLAYIFQTNPIVDIASLPAEDDHQMWKVGSMRPSEIVELAQGTTFRIFAMMPDGRERVLPEVLPAAMLRAFSTAIDGGMWSSMVGDDYTYGIRIQAAHLESITALLDYMKRTIGEDGGGQPILYLLPTCTSCTVLRHETNPKGDGQSNQVHALPSRRSIVGATDHRLGAHL